MPIYEYRCRACDHRFELIVNGSTTPACPACEARDLEKQLSVFAVATARPARLPRSAPADDAGIPMGRAPVRSTNQSVIGSLFRVTCLGPIRGAPRLVRRNSRGFRPTRAGSPRAPPLLGAQARFRMVGHVELAELLPHRT